MASGESAVGVLFEIALVAFAARLEVERLARRVGAGRFDVALVEAKQRCGPDAAHFGLGAGAGEIAQEAVGLLDACRQLRLLSGALDFLEGALGTAFAVGVAALFERGPELLPFAVHIMLGEIAVEALQFLPDRFRIGIRVGGPAAKFRQAVVVLFRVDALVELAQALPFGLRGRRAQPVSSRVPGLIRQPVLPHRDRIIRVIGGEAGGAMLPPGIVSPDGEEQASGGQGAGEGPATRTLSPKVAQPALEGCGGRGAGIAASERSDAAFEERHVVAGHFPELLQPRFIQGLQRLRQPDERAGQTHRMRHERFGLGGHRRAQAADGEHAMLRAVQFEGMARHAEMPADHFVNADTGGEGVGFARQQVGLGQNQRHRPRR